MCFHLSCSWDQSKGNLFSIFLYKGNPVSSQSQIASSHGRYKNGQELSSGDTVLMVSDGHRHRLAIAAIVKADEGEYTFEVSSYAGSASCSAMLTIEGRSCSQCQLSCCVGSVWAFLFVFCLLVGWFVL